MYSEELVVLIFSLLFYFSKPLNVNQLAAEKYSSQLTVENYGFFITKWLEHGKLSIKLKKQGKEK